MGLKEDAGSLNERLIQYYVTKKVLIPPDREGREAIFGYRQAVELLVTRFLLKDGWPLEKIAAIVQSPDLDALAQTVSPLSGTPTRSHPCRGGRLQVPHG